MSNTDLRALLAEVDVYLRELYVPAYMRKKRERLCARITAALAEKDGGWVECSKEGALRNATFIDSKLLGCHIATERHGVWYARKPLPPLPTEKENVRWRL